MVVAEMCDGGWTEVLGGFSGIRSCSLVNIFQFLFIFIFK